MKDLSKITSEIAMYHKFDDSCYGCAYFSELCGEIVDKPSYIFPAEGFNDGLDGFGYAVFCVFHCCPNAGGGVFCLLAEGCETVEPLAVEFDNCIIKIVETDFALFHRIIEIVGVRAGAQQGLGYLVELAGHSILDTPPRLHVYFTGGKHLGVLFYGVRLNLSGLPAREEGVIKRQTNICRVFQAFRHGGDELDHASHAAERGGQPVKPVAHGFDAGCRVVGRVPEIPHDFREIAHLVRTVDCAADTVSDHAHGFLGDSGRCADYKPHGV